MGLISFYEGFPSALRLVSSFECVITQGVAVNFFPSPKPISSFFIYPKTQLIPNLRINGIVSNPKRVEATATRSAVTESP